MRYCSTDTPLAECQEIAVATLKLNSLKVRGLDWDRYVDPRLSLESEPHWQRAEKSLCKFRHIFFNKEMMNIERTHAHQTSGFEFHLFSRQFSDAVKHIYHVNI